MRTGKDDLQNYALQIQAERLGETWTDGRERRYSWFVGRLSIHGVTLHMVGLEDALWLPGR